MVTCTSPSRCLERPGTDLGAAGRMLTQYQGGRS